MNTSFYNGVSGIKSQQFGIDVWANNISNISTIGYKGSTPEFASHFATAMSDSYFEGTINDIGHGTRPSGTAKDMSQGIFQTTDNAFDLALEGEGWFGVQSRNSQTLYTRAGTFSVDKNGDMVDANGNFLLGTSGGNIASTTLSTKNMEQFGRYYAKDASELGEAFSITDIDNIALSGVDSQSKINLPDILYYPPVATTYINYQANLDPSINVDVTRIDLNSADIISNPPNIINQTLTVNGTISNTPEILDPKESQVVFVTITDIGGKSVDVNTELDSNLNWAIVDKDISSLDTTNPLTTTAKLQTDQEIPNVEHFSTEVISPNGDKDILDMTFTKRVPQPDLSSTWDAVVQVLSFYEKYDPSKTYDPTLYKVDEPAGKVYEIIDTQTGDASFGGGGELIQSNMPTLSNSGTPLSISIGTPYEETSLDEPTMSIADETITFTGNAPELNKGDYVNVRYTDPNGVEREVRAKVEEDGSWSASGTYTQSGSITNINAYHILHNGFDGIISNKDLDRARVANKDGKIEGFLEAYGMDGRGNVVAEFSNGESSAVAKIAVYHFQNDQGLESVGDTLFQFSANSSKAIFYTDKDGNFIQGSNIQSNRLENSNVNLATALTELIVMQKAFDASSKSITTSDQMIQNAINMKR